MLLWKEFPSGEVKGQWAEQPYVPLFCKRAGVPLVFLTIEPQSTLGGWVGTQSGREQMWDFKQIPGLWYTATLCCWNLFRELMIMRKTKKTSKEGDGEKRSWFFSYGSDGFASLLLGSGHNTAADCVSGHWPSSAASASQCRLITSGLSHVDNAVYELGLIPNGTGLEKSVPHQRQMSISIKIHVITNKIIGNSQQSFPI